MAIFGVCKGVGWADFGVTPLASMYFNGIYFIHPHVALFAPRNKLKNAKLGNFGPKIRGFGRFLDQICGCVGFMGEIYVVY